MGSTATSAVLPIFQFPRIEKTGPRSQLLRRSRHQNCLLSFLSSSADESSNRSFKTQLLVRCPY